MIFTKFYDEMESGRDKSKILEFRNYGDTCVAGLQDVKLFNSDLDIVDDAFE